MRQEESFRSQRIPPSRLSNTFAAFDLSASGGKMARALERCKAVAEGDAWCAFLYGRPGNGKTHLAIAALHERVGVFWKVPDWLANLRKVTFGESYPYDAETLIQGAGEGEYLLVLDDYGAHNPTDWAQEQLYRVIDMRYENRVPTIVTSNVPLELVDERVTSRFREGLVICEGKDYRGRA